jgi:hypothetical protein
MSQSRETSLLFALTGLGVGLLVFLWNLADMMKGDMTYQPSPGPFLVMGMAACAAYGFLVAGPIGRALAKRLTASDDAGNPQLEEMRSAILGIQAELAETHERLDFTERLLAQTRTPDQLPRQ